MIVKLQKLVNVIKKYRLKGFLLKCGTYVRGRYGKYFNLVDHWRFLSNRKTYKKELLELINSSDYERIVLWRSSFGWNVPLYQRPQHILSRMAEQGCLVFYEVTGMTDKHVQELEQQQPGLYLYNSEAWFYTKLLYSLLKRAQRPRYLQLYSTDWTVSLKELAGFINSGFTLVYEYIDDISPQLSGTTHLPKQVEAKYRYMMQHPESVLTVVTAENLRADVVAQRGEENLVFASNGVDYAFFQDFSPDFIFDRRFEELKQSGKPVLGYYGALAQWMDYDLIKDINDCGKYELVLIGARYDGAFDNSGVALLPRVHYFEPIPYAQLKYYGREMDVLTIPFKLNDITHATSPVKLFEYMALRKPVVTTDMQELRQYKSVLRATDSSDFIACIEKALELSSDPSWLAELDREARENDWVGKAELIIDLMKQHETV